MAHRHQLLTTTLVFLAVASGAAQSAQVPPAEQLPVVEPQLSTLYSSESLDSVANGAAVSPDGRWLVYCQGGDLWIVPLDGSREAVRLTTGPHWDVRPLWFPTADRIVFSSDRANPGASSQGLMTLGIDGASGRPTSVPRQVTLEPLNSVYAHGVSPDGQHLAYVVRIGELRDGFALKVIPAVGGTATLVWRQPETILTPVWSDDGHLYFLSRLASGDDAVVHPGVSVKRVPATGGEAETLSTWPGHLAGRTPFLSGDAKHLIYNVSPRGPGEPNFEIASVRGARLARFLMPDGRLFCFAGQRRECLGTTDERSAPLQVVPATGGPMRQVGETGESAWPIGWTSDSREVVVGGRLDGIPAIMAMPARGGAKRLLYRLQRLQTDEWVYGPYVLDGRYVLYGVAAESAETVVLRILDMETGSERELTGSAWADYTRFNSSRTSDRFLYAVRRNGHFEFRAVDPKGESILLRAFPDSAFPPIIGVHGDRIAYRVASEGASTLFIASAGEDDVREVMTFPADVSQRGSSPPVWSPNGRLLASAYRRRGVAEQHAFVVEIDPSGEVVGEPRIIEDFSPSWGSLTWLPTSDAFLVAGGDLWLVPIDSGTSPLRLTGEESGSTWDFALSPDGRQVAVAPQVRSGGSIWRLDLEEALARLK